jgi:hypothetical protein
MSLCARQQSCAIGWMVVWAGARTKDLPLQARRLARVPPAGGDSYVMALRLPRRAARRPARPVIATAAVVISLGMFAAACGGRNTATPATQANSPSASAYPPPSAGTSSPGRSQTPALPSTAVPSTIPPRSATASPSPAFHSSIAVLTAAMRARMTGVTWHQGCPVSLDRLRLLQLSYWGFDHGVHHGELVVNESAAGSLAHAFRLLFAARFPIRRMQVADDFGGDDERSMLADNTSAFNCRIVPGTAVWSQHAYGLAVDINPFENPEVSNGNVDPPAAAAWADRSRSSPAMIVHGGAAWRSFSAIGWTWGGDWKSLKDYQHFSANGL